jgi:hypothetical protein
MYEEGATDEDGSGNDIFLRTTLDTFKLRLDKEEIFFNQETVTDWDWLKKNILMHFQKGKLRQISRLEHWKKKLQKSKEFYKALLLQNQDQEQEYLHQFSESTKNLKDFVEIKLGEVYKFWSDQPLELQQIFILQTILIHEVGNVDPTQRERKSVAQVVKNRALDDSYHYLFKDDPWKKYVEGDLKDKKYWWLNVLFRKGEFSFMLFFIPSVSKVFCPSRNVLDETLAEENLTLAIQSLANEKVNPNFQTFWCNSFSN